MLEFYKHPVLLTDQVTYIVVHNEHVQKIIAYNYLAGHLLEPHYVENFIILSCTANHASRYV